VTPSGFHACTVFSETPRNAVGRAPEGVVCVVLRDGGTPARRPVSRAQDSEAPDVQVGGGRRWTVTK
jgi:hypothetical protein